MHPTAPVNARHLDAEWKGHVTSVEAAEGACGLTEKESNNITEYVSTLQ